MSREWEDLSEDERDEQTLLNWHIRRPSPPPEDYDPDDSPYGWVSPAVELGLRKEFRRRLFDGSQPGEE